MGLGTVLSKKMRTTPPVRFVVISFLILILIGGLVLALPICSRSGQGTRLPDALFTSVSAVCVTGLSKFDTWVHWSAFGQVVILLLIQLGGLGIITFTTGFTLLFRQKLGLRELSLAARENLQGENLNVSQLLRMILTVTFVAEGAGALLMALRFVPQFGPYGLWLAVFHAVSAYCNAGFDIMGFLQPYGSLIPYAGDPLVMVPTYALMLVGGLGFVVISDVYYNKIYRRIKGQKPSPLSFHSAVVLISELVLLTLGMLAFLSLEYDNTLRGMNWGDKIITAWFQSNTVRTAGFTAVDVTQQRAVTTLFSLVLYRRRYPYHHLGCAGRDGDQCAARTRGNGHPPPYDQPHSSIPRADDFYRQRGDGAGYGRRGASVQFRKACRRDGRLAGGRCSVQYHRYQSQPDSAFGRSFSDRTFHSDVHRPCGAGVVRAFCLRPPYGQAGLCDAGGPHYRGLMKLFPQNEIYPDEKKSFCKTFVSQKLFFIFAIGKPIRPPVFYMGYK